jgi:hypothetical protein
MNFPVLVGIEPTNMILSRETAYHYILSSVITSCMKVSQDANTT